MMKSPLCMVFLMSLLLAGCVNAVRWNSTPVTMKDGVVTEIRSKLTQTDLISTNETAFIVMPDGTLIPCDTDCFRAYELSKAGHQAKTKINLNVRTVEGE